MIHFNTAGAGVMSAQALEVMQTFLQGEREHGAYEAELAGSAVLEHEIYVNVARLIGARPADIALFDSATKAWVTALDALDWNGGGRVLVTPYEYAGNLIALDRLRQRHGVVVEVIPLLGNGDLDLAWLAEHLREDVKLVSIVHVPSCCGIVNDVESIGTLLQGHPCVFFLDACQSVGMLPIDVQRIGCDVLTAAGRKFLCGPRGTGFAYLSKAFRAVAAPRFTDLHRATFTMADGVRLGQEDARCFEYAERNSAALMGLNIAVQDRLRGGYVDDCAAYRFLVEELKGDARLQLILPGVRQRAIVSFFHDAMPAPEAVVRLRTNGINCWAGHASHTPYFMNGRGERFVRVSLGHGSTVSQAEQFMRLLRNMH
ncbi:aminotransferase class V-fold PLP-dependent enzyme [Pseudomonas mosselii]|uniref:Aminotransferase class V-fold PLP-dependent enzyme n=1 Tax=Pseudomonas mosselii TaxID=78327 RepID=A0AA42UM94_9PSED|nr:aminotransferase class V-fold PLP-dependent enzyme [Pseudomonas mosselii]MDH1631407.1 aminotransferase class V-fold PLP-dependent enzyme [Pseudomonas mosselii]